MITVKSFVKHAETGRKGRVLAISTEGEARVLWTDNSETVVDPELLVELPRKAK